MAETKKLTPKQREALATMFVSDGKSGAFYRDLGINHNTLNALEECGLVWATGDWSFAKAQWKLTDAGRRALSEGCE